MSTAHPQASWSIVPEPVSARFSDEPRETNDFSNGGAEISNPKSGEVRGRVNSTSSRWRTAFTLTEVMIVVLIMGIMAAVAYPRFNDSLCRFRAVAAAKRIAADLNLARANAKAEEGIADGEWVSFYPSSDEYKLHGTPTSIIPAMSTGCTSLRRPIL